MKISQFIFTVVLYCYTDSLIAQNLDFTAIDKKVAQIPSNLSSIDSLVSHIERIAFTELDKARAIFKWMHDNVVYNTQKRTDLEQGDLSVIYNKRNFAEIAVQTFNERKGVCGEMSHMYNHVASHLGLTTMTVHGWALRYQKRLYADIPNHGWNSVLIDGKWHLLDCSAKLFLQSPEEMIKTHYPIIPFWQLLDKPVKIDVILGPPLDFPLSKTLNHKLLTPKTLVNYLSQPVFTLELEAEPDQVLYGVLIEDLSVQNYHYFKSIYGNGKHTITINFPTMDKKILYYVVLSTDTEPLYIFHACFE